MKRKGQGKSTANAVRITVATLFSMGCPTSSFVRSPSILPFTSLSRFPVLSTTKFHMARYGPREEYSKDLDASPYEGQEEWERKNAERVYQQTIQFRKLIEEIMRAESPESLPSITSKYLDVLLNMRGYEGVDVLRDVLEEAETSGDKERQEQVEAACDYVLEFMETFVEEARNMDDGYKQLLGKIIKAIAGSGSDAGSARYREEKLDEVLAREQDNFTPGFLRHVENECHRVATAPVMSQESAKLLETLQMVHVRIMEELGKVGC